MTNGTTTQLPAVPAAGNLQEGVTTPPRLPGAKAPVGLGQLPVVAVVWAIMLVALGVVACRDALVLWGVLAGPAWTSQTLTFLDGRTASGWLVPVAVLCLVLALWLLTVAARPRPHNEAQLRAGTSIFLSRASLRRLATVAANDVDGVDEAKVSATRNRVRVVVTTTPDRTEEVRAAVQAAVIDRLAALMKSPDIRVQAKTTGDQP